MARRLHIAKQTFKSTLEDIEVDYNQYRRHGAIGLLSPDRFGAFLAAGIFLGLYTIMNNLHNSAEIGKTMNLKVPTIIDLEASGFGSQSYPIEVGFSLPNGRLECTLIRPEPSWTHWDESAYAVHGITRELLLAFGKPVDQVAHWLNKQLKGMTVYSDAWGHDYAWLAVLFDAANLAPSFKLDHLASIMPECESARWNQLHQEIELELGLKRHRASNDALMLQRTWVRLIESNQFSAA